MAIFLGTLLLILAVFVNVAELKEALPYNADVVTYTLHTLTMDKDVFYTLANGTTRNLKAYYDPVPCLVTITGKSNVLAAVDENENVRQLYLGPIKNNKTIMLNFGNVGDKKYVPMPKWVADLYGIKFNKPIPPQKELHSPVRKTPKDNGKH